MLDKCDLKVYPIHAGKDIKKKVMLYVLELVAIKGSFLEEKYSSFGACNVY